MLSTNSMSPADLGAIMGNNSDGFGNGSWLWFLIVIFALFGGFGNGYGNNNGAMDNYVLASDFSQLSRQIESAADGLQRQVTSVADGLCSGFYTQAQLVNGVNENLASQGYETRNAITQAQINQMQNANAIQSQMSECCCNTKSAISDLNYNLATTGNGITNAITSGFCNTNYNASTNTRDIIDSQNASTRAILDAIQQNKVDAMQEKINEQNQTIQALNLAQSQAVQNNAIISALRPSPVPAYITSNPYCNCGGGYAYSNYYGSTIA